LENIAKKIATLVYDRINYDNYDELTDIIYDFGKTYDVMIKVVSPDGSLVASYPSVMNMVNSRIKNEKTYETGIMLNNESTLGKISISLPYNTNHQITKITYIGTILLVIVIFAIQWWSSSSIKFLVSEISRLSNYDKIDGGGHKFIETQRIHRALLDKIALIKQYERDSVMGVIAKHVAHDMRSPLSVLKMYVEMTNVRAGKDEEDVGAAAERSVKKLLRMADDLVDYSKASILERTRDDFGKLISDTVLAETRRAADANKVSLHYNLGGCSAAEIDHYKLGRVLVNIVHNAIQAMPDEGGAVRIDTKQSLDGTLLVTVADNGKGIEPEHLPKIFDNFFTKGKKGGTGLGLAYCKQVVEAHGGTIGVESEVGMGTTFTIRIPGCVRPSNVRMA
jgi:signal transduction histidine kinase